MGLVQVVPLPTGEPLELQEALEHLILELDSEDRDLVSALIVAARERAETVTGRALLTQNWRLTLDAFPGSHCWQREDLTIRLPKPPLQLVTSVKYLDPAGVLQTLAGSDYIVDVAEVRGRIAPAWGKVWPVTRDTLNAVTIDFKAGYGDDATAVPQTLKQAMKLLIGGWYENREAVISGTIIAELPMSIAATALLWQHRAREVT